MLSMLGFNFDITYVLLTISILNMQVTPLLYSFTVYAESRVKMVDKNRLTAIK